jgi:hypothetical protein
MSGPTPEDGDFSACRFAPLPNGSPTGVLREGHDDESFSVVMACWVSKASSYCKEGLKLLPLGDIVPDTCTALRAPQCRWHSEW